MNKKRIVVPLNLKFETKSKIKNLPFFGVVHNIRKFPFKKYILIILEMFCAFFSMKKKAEIIL